MQLAKEVGTPLMVSAQDAGSPPPPGALVGATVGAAEVPPQELDELGSSEKVALAGGPWPAYEVCMAGPPESQAAATGRRVCVQVFVRARSPRGVRERLVSQTPQRR